MASVNVYLNFNGNCEEAFNFYKDNFGMFIDKFGVNWMMSWNEGGKM